ncbi:MAG: hypothetical protein ACREIT_00485, partial [Tepidisphaeraceae bacterium]
MSPPRVFITIAERSADQHAANLVRALRRLRPDVMIEGLGGPLLRDAGATIHFDTVTRAAMGLRALLRAREVSRLLRWTRRHFDTHGPPDLQICCDSWAMNCHFGELAKSRGASVLYYIAPQAWASREGRAKRMQGFVDRLACILPFEEAFFRERGVNATFVGHPLFDELPSAEQRLVDRPARTKSYSQRPPIVGLLAGSRRSVAAANFPRQLEVADAIKVAFPGARFVCPT